MTARLSPAQLDGRSPRHAYDLTEPHVSRCVRCTRELAYQDALRERSKAPQPPARALGELVRDGKHVGWITAEGHVVTGVVRGGLILFPASMREHLAALEGQHVAVLPVITDGDT